MTKTSEISGYQEAKKKATEWNKELNDYRKRDGLSIDDVVAISPQYDPFWMTAGKILKARWAENIMKDVIKPHLRRINVDNIHLRDIHYILTGMNYSTWDSSEIYQNTEKHWQDLIMAFSNARYLGYVDSILIRDNKNKYNRRADYGPEEDFQSCVKHGKEDLSKESILGVFASWFDVPKNWYNHMPVHIEIWAEKDLALLEQVAQKCHINTVVGEGDTSVTQVYQIVERIKKAGKPVRIAYIADCDVVGSNMSKAMSRKMEFVLRQLEADEFDVKLTHLMLTPAQVRQYNLPTIPMKVSKSGAYEARKNEWMNTRGLEGAVEINSFHALYPDEFKAILVRFINSYFDFKINSMVYDFNIDQSKHIKKLISEDENINSLLEKFLTALTNAIDNIDWEEQESKCDTDFEKALDDCDKLVYSNRDKHYQWLLDTELQYEEQLDRYNKYEDGALDNPEEAEQ